MNTLLPIIHLYGMHCINFYKEYTANTKKELVSKLQGAKAGVCERLAQLDIIPQKIVMDKDHNFYEIENGKLAVKIHFELDYYSLRSSTPEEREKIYQQIREEQHHMKHFGEKRVSKPCLLRGVRYTCGYENMSRIVITADSERELIDKVKTNIWALLKEDNETPQFNIRVKIDNLKFEKTPDGKCVASYIQHNQPVQRRTEKEDGKNCDDKER